MTFDSIPATTTTMPLLTTPPTLPAVSPLTQTKTAGAWVDATTNLLGHPAQCGGVTLVSVRPSGDRVIAGLSGTGLYASDNGSDKWTQLAPRSAPVSNRPSSIVYDPRATGTFWESGIYGHGIYRSTDDGASISRLGDIEHSDQVSVDLSDPQRRTLLSGTHEKAQVYRSKDGGSTWTDLARSLPANIGYASFPYAADATTFLLGTRNGTNAGVYRSTDGGQSWRLVHPGAVAGPVVVTDDGHLYWLLAGGGRLIESSDNGASWTESDHSGPVLGLLALPGNRLAAVGVQNVVVSSDRGATWTAVGPPLPFSTTGLAYSASRKSFYIWRGNCAALGFGANNPVLSKAIMRLQVTL